MSRKLTKGSTGRKGKKAGLSQHLLAYSVTAGAAMTVAATAQAGVTNIVSGDDGNLFFGGSHVTNSNPPIFFLSFNPGSSVPVHIGTYATALVIGYNGSSAGGSAQLQGAFAQTAHAGTHQVVKKMAANDPIGNSLNFAGPADNLYLWNPGGSGKFTPAQPQGYIAFHFQKGGAGHTYYGWMKIGVTFGDGGYPTDISLLPTSGDIYGAFAPKGEIFVVGETASAPEPSSLALSGLGLLAFGAAGIREMRRRRAAA